MQILKKPSEYMLLIIAILFNGNPWTSGKIHEELIKRMNGKHPSRASVINYLKRLHAHNHVTLETRTGKGGYYRIYTLKGNQLDFSMRLESQMNNQFREEYLDPLEALA